MSPPTSGIATPIAISRSVGERRRSRNDRLGFGSGSGAGSGWGSGLGSGAGCAGASGGGIAVLNVAVARVGCHRVDVGGVGARATPDVVLVGPAVRPCEDRVAALVGRAASRGRTSVAVERVVPGPAVDEVVLAPAVRDVFASAGADAVLVGGAVDDRVVDPVVLARRSGNRAWERNSGSLLGVERSRHGARRR